MRTWNVGMVERMSMMIEDKRNNELTITNTCKSKIYQISKSVWIKYHLIMTGLKVMSLSIVPKQSHTPILHIIFNLLLIRTLAAEEELGSSKRVQMTLRNRAPHNPSNWSIYKHTYIKPVERGIYLSPSPRSATVYLCIISHFVFVYGTHLIILGQLVVRHREEPGRSLQRVGAARLEVEGAQAPVLQLTHEVLAGGSMTFAHQLF